MAAVREQKMRMMTAHVGLREGMRRQIGPVQTTCQSSGDDERIFDFGYATRKRVTVDRLLQKAFIRHYRLRFLKFWPVGQDGTDLLAQVLGLSSRIFGSRCNVQYVNS